MLQEFGYMIQKLRKANTNISNLLLSFLRLFSGFCLENKFGGGSEEAGVFERQ